jgi:hypothetical protein
LLVVPLLDELGFDQLVSLVLQLILHLHVH